METDAWAALCTVTSLLSRTRLSGERWRHGLLLRREDRRARLSAGAAQRARQLLRLARRGGWPGDCRLARRQGDGLRRRRRRPEDSAPGGLQRARRRHAGGRGEQSLFTYTDHALRIRQVANQRR